MTPTEQLANVPHPAGATEVDEWFDPDDPIGDPVTTISPDTARYFVGSQWVVEHDNRDTDTGVHVARFPARGWPSLPGDRRTPAPG